jgi:CRP-like cAMP-binding protein
MSPLFHIVNVLTLASYVVKDILWLRALAVVSSLLVLIGGLLKDAPWEAIAWQSVFVVINVVQIKLLLLERRPVRLREDEQRLYQLVFRALKPREFAKLLALGSWEDKTKDETIVTKGEALDRIMVIYDGKAAVVRDGKKLVELGAGRFIGEMSFLTGQVPAADVQTTERARLVAWSHHRLKSYLDKNPNVRSAMQLIIGTDLVAKLRSPSDVREADAR